MAGAARIGKVVGGNFFGQRIVKVTDTNVSLGH